MFTHRASDHQSYNFDLILDKSTLDCLLCSDDGAAGPLSIIYNHLIHGGIYFVLTVSCLCKNALELILTFSTILFQRKSILHWMLRNMLGERVINPDKACSQGHIEENEYDSTTESHIKVLTPNNVPSAWSSGEFINPHVSTKL